MLACVLTLAGCGTSVEKSALEKAETALSQRNYTDALEQIQAMGDEAGHSRRIQRDLGICYLETGQYALAEEALNKSLSLSSGVPGRMDYDTSFYLADCFSKEGRTADAIEVYDSILALHKKNRDALYLRGVCRLAQGEADAAMEDFKRTLELNSQDYDRAILIYEALADAGEEDAGKSLLQEIMARNETSMTNYQKGLLSYYLGNNADAQNFLEKARGDHSEPDKSRVILLLGQTGEKQTDYNYAISVYKSFLSEEPTHAEVYNRLGLCEMQQGNLDAAIRDFDSGLKLKDDSTTRALMRNKAAALEKAGRFSEASVLLQEYLQMWPEDQEAVRERTFLSTRSDTK